MKQKKKYKYFLLLCLVLDLLAIVFLGYRYADRKIPDEIHVSQDSPLDLTQISGVPFISFGDTIAVSGSGTYQLPCSFFGKIPFKNIKVIPTPSSNLLVSGSTVGLYMETEGVLVIDTQKIRSLDGDLVEPAKNLLKPGDYILSFNDKKISTKQDLIDDLESTSEGSVTLRVKRNQEVIPVSLTPVQDASGNYKLGIWVRDDAQGIGTLTYVTPTGEFGALGHGICDVDTGNLLSVKEGKLYCAEILGVQKGEKGSPGELSGLIRYRDDNIIGTIEDNYANGIYGTYTKASTHSIFLKQMQIGYKQELQIGPATILCNVGDGTKEYHAQITRIDLNHEDDNKSFVIHITDPKLLSITGGIVQGMSGSPILQNGKVVGAVTHVFVQDATSGYGIFIENMLKR